MHFKRKRGFTTIEVLTVSAILAMLMGAITASWIGVCKSYDGVTTETYTATDAVTSLQRIVTDVREVKSVQLMDYMPSPNANQARRLRVQFPTVPDPDNGWYDRYTVDTTKTTDYYLANSNGTLNTTGTWLWRNQGNGADKRVIARDVKSVIFEADTERSVKITIIASNPSVAGDRLAELTQRVVYLRNY